MDIEVNCFTNRIQSEQTLIAQARALIEQPRWRNLEEGKWDSKLFDIDPERCFTYNEKPPRIPFVVSDPELKEWGAEVTPDEIFALEDLAEFAPHVAVASSVNPSKRGLDTIDFQTAGPNEAETSERLDSSSRVLESNEPPAKRVKRSHTVTLFNAIPWPHQHSRPSPAIPAPAGIRIVEPHGVLIVYKAITEPQAHWLVPIQCSATLFSHLDNTPSTALYSINLLPDNPPSSQSNRIYWTYHSLVSFWVFLLEVRKRNKFGPLAITYLYNAPELAFVKITCDTPNAMRFRTVLRSWRCQMDADDPPPSTVEKEVLNSSASARPLKFARLLLVDESGDNLLIA